MAVELQIVGVVQGVGFRPFVHRTAHRYGLAGWVRNEAGAVRIHVEGSPSRIDAFERALQVEAPPLARIDALTRSTHPATGAPGASGATTFEIVASDTVTMGRLPVSPDMCLCAACERELFDPADRRYRYPFITCTDCGPRFTVIESMPYDRERSTMRAFHQCPSCLAEYRDPTDRRYHSETNSCSDCGPRLWYVDPSERHGESSRWSAPEGRSGPTEDERSSALAEAADALLAGRIVAVRGLGGFHLAVDATNERAVQRLRMRKLRESKPLAVMVRTQAEARALGTVGPAERALLTSRERPIVLLRRSWSSNVAPSVAPGVDRIGVMIAYTPLHQLLLDLVRRPLVMTSGNRSDEPIATGNDEALARLNGIADGYLLHDREIVARYDDSVARIVEQRRVTIRRARGYAPLPLALPVPATTPVLAVGPHLKNTFTLASGTSAFVSQHIGDMENLETLEHFEESLGRFTELFRIEPRVLVRDLHPGYLTSGLAERLAEREGLGPVLAVQHHHAHVVAVMAEHGKSAPLLGVALDGTGYGDDGRIWGAEFLLADLTGYRRLGQLRYAPLPGGDLASRRPWRSALGYASLDPGASHAFERAFAAVPEVELAAARYQIERGLNAPRASSMGRLFDAAAAVLGLRTEAGYEGQAPMELEALAGTRPGQELPFPALEIEGGRLCLDPLPLLMALAEGRNQGRDRRDLAASFHDTVVRAVVDAAERLARRSSVGTVALAGGCFQNERLLRGVRAGLESRLLEVLLPIELGPNDGAISYGQAASAAALLDGASDPNTRR